MHTISQSLNIEKIKGSSIGEICFSLNTISLYFEKIGFISILGSFSLSFEQKCFTYGEIYPVNNDFNLLQLLGKQVVDINIASNQRELIIQFENLILRLVSNDHYESFIIEIDGNKIVV